VVDIAVAIGIRESQPLPPVAGGAPELLHRMLVENLLVGVRARPRLLHILQPSPIDSQMTGGAAIDEVQILDPDLLDPPGKLGGIYFSDFFRHDELEFGLVIFPLRRGVHEHGRETGAESYDGNHE
jgi:hypothetical protein